MKRIIQTIVVVLLIPVMLVGALAGLVWSGIELGFRAGREDFWS